MFVIIGYALVLFCVFGGYIFVGGNVAILAKAAPIEMFIIFGAASGAFLVANPSKTVKATFKPRCRRCSRIRSTPRRATWR
jgi:chemotaxis protein MotA